MATLLSAGVKGTGHPKNKNTDFSSYVVQFVNLDCTGVSCLVLEISALEISASLIVLLTAPKIKTQQ